MTSLIPLEAQWFNPLSWEGAPLMAVVSGLWVIVMARSNATYWLGRAMARGTANTRWRRMLESPHYATGQRWLDRWGAPAVTLSFLTVGIQTMVNLAAGVMRMPLRKYIPATAIGSVLWAFMYGTVGFIGWVAIERLWAFSPWLVLLLVLLLVLGIIVHIKYGREERTAEPDQDETAKVG